MPPRSSARRPSRSPLRPAPPPVGSGAHDSVASHGSSIMILWVLIVCMSVAVWLVLLVTMYRVDQIERALTLLQQRVTVTLRDRPATDSVAMLLAKSAVGTSTNAAVAPANTTSVRLLVRGSASPDGSKYAGFDDTTKGRIGIGVEILATKQVKHLVIFNPREESSGQGTPSESDLSVRWKDDHTIEYDLLVRKNGEWVKETQTVRIFF